VAAADVGVAVRLHDQEAHRLRNVQRVPHEQQRRLGRPLQIVENEQQRFAGRGGRQPSGHGVEEPVLLGRLTTG
jgi:hypothetical protein